MKLGKCASKFLTGTKLGQYITRKLLPDGLSGIIKKKIAQAPVIKVSVFDLFENPALQGEQKALSGFISGMEAQGRVTVAEPYSISARKASSKSPIPKFWKDVYDDVIEEFNALKPAKSEANPFWETRTHTQEHLNGETTISMQDLSGNGYNGYPFSWAKLQSKGKTLLHVGKLDKTPTVAGEDAVVKEFNEFLGGEAPTIDSFNAFVKQRNMQYMYENGIPDLKALRKSVSAGKEVARQEERYRMKRQYDYEHVFRPYHTEPFYRVIGMEELTKLLRGETIISKNSKARYGRPCVDVTTNGYYHDIFYGEQKFRIEFKRVKPNGSGHSRFASRIYDFREEKCHYQVPSYDIQDVELGKIKYWNGSDWCPLSISIEGGQLRISG